MPTSQGNRSELPDNLMIIIGQLLEATKAASDGLKSVSQEVQSNAKAIIAASNTVEILAKTAGQLEEVVSDPANPNNLVNLVQAHATTLAALKATIVDVREAVDGLREDLGRLGTTEARLAGKWDIVWTLTKLGGWIVGTAVACWAAYAQGQR